MTEDILPGGELAGICGWDANGPHKLNLLWGYYASYFEAITNLNAAAGSNTLAGSVVPVGEIWVLEAISLMNATSASAAVYGYLNMTSGILHIHPVQAPVAGRPYSWTGRLTMGPGSSMQALFQGCTAGDVLYATFVGHKMKIDP